MLAACLFRMMRGITQNKIPATANRDGRRKKEKGKKKEKEGRIQCKIIIAQAKRKSKGITGRRMKNEKLVALHPVPDGKRNRNVRCADGSGGHAFPSYYCGSRQEGMK